MRKLVDWILDCFRKKEYYVIDYDELNNFSIEFKEVNNEVVDKVKIVVSDFKEASSISDKKANLKEETALKFSDIEDIVAIIKDTVSEDYRKSYFEAIEKNWEFNYFVTDYRPIYSGSLFVCNRIYSSTDNEMGEVMYPLLAIRKVNGDLYFWKLIENYDGFL